MFQQFFYMYIDRASAIKIYYYYIKLYILSFYNLQIEICGSQIIEQRINVQKYMTVLFTGNNSFLTDNFLFCVIILYVWSTIFFRDEVNEAVLGRNVKILAEALARHVFNITHAEDMEIFVDALVCIYISRYGILLYELLTTL